MYYVDTRRFIMIHLLRSRMYIIEQGNILVTPSRRKASSAQELRLGPGQFFGMRGLCLGAAIAPELLSCEALRSPDGLHHYGRERPGDDAVHQPPGALGHGGGLKGANGVGREPRSQAQLGLSPAQLTQFQHILLVKIDYGSSCKH